MSPHYLSWVISVLLFQLGFIKFHCNQKKFREAIFCVSPSGQG